MNSPGQLRIDELRVAPGQEWSNATPAWRFVRVTAGAAYWLDSSRPRGLAAGELLVIVPSHPAIIRASQLNEVVLHGFSFFPELLCGFFTLAERHFFASGAACQGEPVRFLPSTHPLAEQFGALLSRRASGQELSQRAEALVLVATCFSERMTQHRLPKARDVSAHFRFQQLISQMPDLEIIQHTPEAMARLCGCSPRHFNRLFHQFFGESPRERQTELRLLKARHLLTSTKEKVVQVALDSGYRSLSLFNALFKRRFGMSPSECRQKLSAQASGASREQDKRRSQSRKQAAKNAGRLLSSLGLAWLLCFSRAAAESGQPGGSPEFSPLPPAPATANDASRAKAAEALDRELRSLTAGQKGAKRFPLPRSEFARGGNTNARPAVARGTNGPVFEVRGYELLGNTLLPPPITDPVLERYTGPAVDLAMIRQGLADLQMAYRDRGFVTVSVSLPRQKLTNGIVKVQVTEGRLAEINVLNNHYFSSNNIMRELPSLRTNSLLNALVFQQELDRANANRDRQIYPVLSPGPEPGTSLLDLKIKDRLPLHTHFDLNNYSTPNTPELRADAAVSYGNLWQLNHQVGFQYSFSPEAYKSGSYNFYDQPLIANYSAYYRLPLAGDNGPQRTQDHTLTDFGYNEATRRFQPPPATGASELLFYASRGFSDTGDLLQESEVHPAVIPDTGGLQYNKQIYSRTLNPNEDLGARFSLPLPLLGRVASSVSAGLDYKNYRSTLIQQETFQGVFYVPEFGSTGPPFVEFPSQPQSASQQVFNSLQYLPVTVSLDGSAPDAGGVTSFTLRQSFNFSGALSGRKQFEAVAGSTNASGTYYLVAAGVTREQKLAGEWGLRLHADGQWATEPLISNEQFSVGGQAGPRGYREGEEYGDTGWRVQFEPHSPYWNLGLAFNKAPIITRCYAFVDYGESYLLDPGTRESSVSLLGVGGGLDVSIGEHFDAHVTLGIPLLDTPLQERGHPRVTFSLSTQW